MIGTLIEAALRSILVAAVVGAGLKALRVRNVVVLKTAWGMVLGATLLMPFLTAASARWALLPAAATLRLPARLFVNSREAAPAGVASAGRNTETNPPLGRTDSDDLAAYRPLRQEPVARRVRGSGDKALVTPAPQTDWAGAGRYPAPVMTNTDSSNQAGSRVSEAAPARWRPEPGWLALQLYLAVAGVLLLRLLHGFTVAMRLWLEAQPVSGTDASRLAGGLPLRSSAAVSAPVTIGSGILLPADYPEWDTEKLSIVIAHERSHVSQGDFYLQMLAGLYAALVWVSPLGWWLKRKLSDLSEAISDRAGLEQAASPSLYARILLEFAALPRPTLAGVAMARTSNLAPRIERLLNERSFRQAFAGGGRRAVLAVVLVPAIFAATALIRVEAAAKPAAGLAVQTSGVSNPEQADSVPVNQAATPAAAVSPAGEPVVLPAPAAVPLPAATPATVDLVNPASADDIRVMVDKAMKDIQIKTDIHPDVHIASKAINDAVNLAVAQGVGASELISRGWAKGYAYSFSDNGDSYAVIDGKGEHLSFSGNWNGDVQKQIDKARQEAHGKFLWFTRNGKSYILDNPGTVDQIQQMYMPMEELGREQQQFARQQEEFAKQQAELSKQMEKTRIPTPDMSKEMAELNAAVAKLEASKVKTMTAEQMADLEGKIGNLQGKLGSIQGEIGALEDLNGEKMGKLGDLQGKLGAEQGKLGAKQGRLAMEADRKIKAIIDEALRDGKAKPID
jgi:hypothetical protein